MFETLFVEVSPYANGSWLFSPKIRVVTWINAYVHTRTLSANKTETQKQNIAESHAKQNTANSKQTEVCGVAVFTRPAHISQFQRYKWNERKKVYETLSIGWHFGNFGGKVTFSLFSRTENCFHAKSVSKFFRKKRQFSLNIEWIESESKEQEKIVYNLG